MGQLFDRVTQLILYTTTRRYVFEDYDTEFDIFSTSASDPNTAKISIWGLSEDQRGLFGPDLQSIEFYAGYSRDDVGMIFRGSWDPTKSIAHHIKQGPDWETQIETGDGLKESQGAYFNQSFVGGTTLLQVITLVATTFGLPIQNEFPRAASETFLHAATFTGRSSQILDDLAWSFKFDWSIQHGALIITERDEPSQIAGIAHVLNHNTGLVGNPTITEKGFELRTLMLSNIKPKSLIQIQDPQLVGKLEAMAARLKPRQASKFGRAVSQSGIYVVDQIQYNGGNRSQEFGCTIGVLFL